MLVLGERVAGDVARAAARGDERDLARRSARIPRRSAAAPPSALQGARDVGGPPHAAPGPCRRSRGGASSACRARRAPAIGARRLARLAPRRYGATGMPRRWNSRFSERRSCATSSARGGGQTGRRRRDRARGVDRHVLPVEGDDVDARREARELPQVVELAGDDRRDRGARHVARCESYIVNSMPSGMPARAIIRPSWPAPTMPMLHGRPQPAAGRVARGLPRSARSRNAARASWKGGWRPARIAVGEQRGVARARFADRDRRDRDAGRHLRDREQRIESVQRLRLDRHADHGQQRLGRPSCPAGVRRRRRPR